MNRTSHITRATTHVYLDTSAWNCLCDQAVEPRALVEVLARCGATLALGFNVMYEMAKLFHRGRESDKKRGRELMTYMKGYLARRVPIVQENWALLIEEALDVTCHTPMRSCFRSDDQYQMAVSEIDKLILNGSFEPEGVKFFDGRKSLVRDSRTLIKGHLESRPDSRSYLSAVSDDGLSSFLATESTGPTGERLLLGHLSRQFPDDPVDELRQVVKLLLADPRYRISRAFPRADLYLNWRCAKRGSIRSDLPDDVFHVISAAYCDVFVTTEGDQADIARHVIDGIRTIICNPRESISTRIQQEIEIRSSASA
jgi:hypothetical protein